jgi:hypothetical protein
MQLTDFCFEFLQKKKTIVQNARTYFCLSYIEEDQVKSDSKSLVSMPGSLKAYVEKCCESLNCHHETEKWVLTASWVNRGLTFSKR